LIFYRQGPPNRTRYFVFRSEIAILGVQKWFQNMIFDPIQKLLIPLQNSGMSINERKLNKITLSLQDDVMLLCRMMSCCPNSSNLQLSQLVHAYARHREKPSSLRNRDDAPKTSRFQQDPILRMRFCRNLLWNHLVESPRANDKA
jgi:hypothetical protein